MVADHPEKPTPPDVPKYVLEPLGRQSSERLEAVATYAERLAEWKRVQRAVKDDRRRTEQEIDEGEQEELEAREISTDPSDYDDVPASGAYITVKTTKQTGERSYRYFYWQWREGDSWKNEYIAPVDPKEQ